jgi:hypothetical protein
MTALPEGPRGLFAHFAQMRAAILGITEDARLFQAIVSAYLRHCHRGD